MASVNQTKLSVLKVFARDARLLADVHQGTDDKARLVRDLEEKA